MDDSFIYIINEIPTFENGCDISTFIQLLKSYEKYKNQTLDEPFIQHFWLHFSSIATLKGIYFIQIESSTNKSETSKERVIPNQEIIGSNLSYISNTYGDSFRIISSEQERKNALLHGVQEDSSITPAVMKVLKVILSCREKGVTQLELAKKLALDPRTLFHVIKVLRASKLVVRIPIIEKGCRTNLLLHPRFASKNQSFQLLSSYDSHQADENQSNISLNLSGFEGEELFQASSRLVRNSIEIILRKAKNNIMYAEDLMKALGVDGTESSKRKWFNRTCENLTRSGFLDRLMVPGPNNKNIRCFQLTKDVNKEAEVVSSDTFSSKECREVDLKIPCSISTTGQGKLLFDISLEVQIYKLVVAGGESGLLTSELCEKLGNISYKVFEKAAHRLIVSKDDPKLKSKENDRLYIYRAAEFEGKTRCYRYYCYEAFQKLSEKWSHIDDIQSTSNIESTYKKKSNSITPKCETHLDVAVGKDNHIEMESPQIYQTTLINETEADSLSKLQEELHLHEINDVVMEDIKESEYNETSDCGACKKSENKSLMCICDECNRQRFHIYCLKPPLAVVPKRLWYCSSCALRKGVQVHHVNNSNVKDPLEDIAPSAENVVMGKHYITEDATSISMHKRYHSLTAIKRKKILIDLLEKEKILEINVDLTARIQAIFGESKTKLDKKTISRLACNMEKEKCLKRYLVSLPLLNGSFQSRTLLLHPDLDVKSTLVTDYIKDAKCKMMLTGNNKVQNVPVKEIEVENLDEIIQRSGVTYIHPSEEKVKPEPGCDSELIENKYNNTLWVTTALNYGYVSARMIRVRLLHEYLFDLVYSNFKQNNLINEHGQIISEIEENRQLNKDCRILDTIDIFSNLTLDNYLKFIGHTSVSLTLNDYLKSGQPLNVKLHSLPIDLRNDLYGMKRRTKIRNNVKRLIDILVCLGLIREPSNHSDILFPFQNPDNSSELKNKPISKQYEFLLATKLFNIGKPGKPFLRDCLFNSRDAVAAYWGELQYLCDTADMESKRNPQRSSLSKGAMTQDDFNFHRRQNDKNSHPLQYITNSRNWRCFYPFTSEQRLVLENYINRKSGTTPLTNEVVCSNIASELGVSTSRVKSFYQLYEEMFFRNQLRQKIKEYTLLKRNNLAKDSKKVVEISREISKKLEMTTFSLRSQQFSKSKSSNRVHQRKLRTSYAKAVHKIMKGGEVEHFNPPPPELDSSEAVIEKNYKKRVRIAWTAEEDELLTLCYVILRVKFMGMRFVYSPAVVFFPDFNADLLRRRIAMKRRDPDYERRLQLLLLKWQREYPLAIENGDLPLDPELNEEELKLPVLKRHQLQLSKFDIRAYVDYFKKYLSKSPIVGEQHNHEIQLPESTEDIYKYFNVKVLPNPTAVINNFGTSKEGLKTPDNPIVLFQDELEYVETTRTKFQIMYGHALRCHSNDEFCSDFPTTKISMEPFIEPGTPIPLKPNDSDFVISSSLNSYDNKKVPVDIMSLYEVDNEKKEDSKDLFEHIPTEKAKVLIKMILLTPDKFYNPVIAFSILESYSQSSLYFAMGQLREAGTLVKNKMNNERRIPGKGYNLSERFLSTFAGALPIRLFADALAFHAKINEKVLLSHPSVPMKFSPFIENGEMAALINLFVSGKISLESKYIKPAPPVAIRERKYNADFIPKAEINIIRNDTLISGHRERKRSSACFVSNQVHKKHLKSAEEEQDNVATVNSELIPFICFLDDPQDNYEADLLTHTYEFIKSKGQSGALLYEIYNYCKNKSILVCRTSLLQTLSILQTPLESHTTIENLVSDGRLIYCVGMQSLRYVHYQFATSWCISLSSSFTAYSPISQVESMDESSSYSLSSRCDAEKTDSYPISTSSSATSNSNRKVRNFERYSLPLMWYDLNGNLVNNFIKGAMESILGFILLRPGLSFSSIYRRFQCMVNRFELLNLLELLEEKDAIYHFTLPLTAQVGLFSKEIPFQGYELPKNLHDSSSSTPSSHYINSSQLETVAELECSFYFAKQDFYLKTRS